MTQHPIAPEKFDPAAAEPPDAPGPTEATTSSLKGTLETLLAAGILDPETGGLDRVKLLAQLTWDTSDGPQRMTLDEAREVCLFGLHVIEGRKVWPTDPVGAAIQIARQEHEWAPAEPGEFHYYGEEGAISDAVNDHLNYLYFGKPEE